MASLARVAYSGAPWAPEAISCMYISKRYKATQLTTTNYKRGTGGRSSFSGIVATVFGGKSTLGSKLINRLGKIGSQVIIPYRGDPSYIVDMKLMGDLGQILFNPFDLKDDDSIRRSIQYSNVVINLIGQEFETKNFSYTDVHVEGPRKIARYAKEMGVERFIHVSTLCAGVKSSNLLKGGSKFLASKREGELAVLEEFPEAIIMRPSIFVDTTDKFMNYYAERPRVYYAMHSISTPVGRILQLWHGGEDTVKRPVLPIDVANGIINAISDPDAPGKIFQCTGPESYKLVELVDFIYRLQRRDVQIEDGYKILLMKAMIREKIYEKLGFPLPRIIPDMLEKETVSDKLDPELPTLLDLGITPTNVENEMRILNRPYLDSGFFKDRIGTLVKPKMPSPVVEKKVQI